MLPKEAIAIYGQNWVKRLIALWEGFCKRLTGAV
jgi:hypothetical protein